MPLIKKKKPAAKKPLAKKRPVRKRIVRKKPLARVEAVIERKVERGKELKFYAEPARFDFPSGYGDNRIVLMVRDPHWVFAYWEVNEKRRREIRAEIGEAAFSKTKEHLRVYDTENWSFFDIEVTGGARNWYIKVPSPNRTYCVDIGFLTADGKFITAARSNWVTTPLDRMSDVIDEEWMIPDWNKMYALSGGYGIGLSSQELRRQMKKRFLQESASGWVSSLSSPVKKWKRAISP